jgi:hypothetical protein
MSGLPEFRGIRSEDYLQDVSGQFRTSIETLRSHYYGIHELLEQLQQSADSLQRREELEQAIRRVQEYASRVRIG